MEGCNVFWLLHLGKLRRMLIWNLESVDISIMTVITKNSQPNLNLCSICCSSWLQVYWAWWHSSQSTYRVGWCHCKTFLNYFWINKQKKKAKNTPQHFWVCEEVSINWKLANIVPDFKKGKKEDPGLSVSLQSLVKSWRKLFRELLKNTWKTMRSLVTAKTGSRGEGAA